MTYRNLRTLLAEEGILTTASPRGGMKRFKVQSRGGKGTVLLTPAQAKLLKLVPGGRGRRWEVAFFRGYVRGVVWEREARNPSETPHKKLRQAESMGLSKLPREGSKRRFRDTEGNIISFDFFEGLIHGSRYSIDLRFYMPMVLEEDQARDNRERERRNPTPPIPQPSNTW